MAGELDANINQVQVIYFLFSYFLFFEDLWDNELSKFKKKLTL
jgi:hypothetical protein